MSPSLVPVVLIAVVLVALVLATLLARRRGYNMPGEIYVRCSQGHLFKAIRLGLVRFQHCPVGDHWAFVTPVKESDLSEEEKAMADRYRDTPIP